MPLGPPSMGSTVLSFSFPVTHRAPGAITTNAEGYQVSAAAVDTEILAHVWPAGPEIATSLPDGVALDDVIEGCSTSELLTLGSATAEPSRIVVDGRVYRLFKLGPWRGGPTGAVRYRAFAAADY